MSMKPPSGEAVRLKLSPLMTALREQHYSQSNAELCELQQRGKRISSPEERFLGGDSVQE